MTVIPAYGRDYKSATAVKADWEEGKDFIIRDVSDPWAGRPVNKEQYTHPVYVLYDKLTKVVRVQ